MLVLRVCDKDLKSYNGFQWPEHGYVEALDWNPIIECRSGLHGWAWGEGNGFFSFVEEDSKWLVVDVDDNKIIPLFGMVKFPYGNVIFCGDKLNATKYIIEHGAKGIVIGATIVVDEGIVRVGDYGTAKVRTGGLAEAGFKGTAISGKYGTSNVGVFGVAITGDFGRINIRNGIATAGKYSVINCGIGSIASAGEGGRIQTEWYDYNKDHNICNRYRLAVGYIGEDGLEPNVKYKVEKGKFLKVNEEKND
jgi:hypothetical protein